MEEQSDTPRMSIKFSGELGMSLLNRIAQLERERDEARAKVEILLATVERAKTVCGATADAYRHDYDSIEQHVAEAVAREREACAQTCEDAELLDRQSREDMAYCEAVSHCADLIRARGTP